jgi:RHS repeat-associated protein
VENTSTETQTFTLYGLLNFNVEYWNGSSWVTVPGGSVTGNNKVWRKFTFSPITTSKIRVYITAVPDAWSRVVEIQAFGISANDQKVQWLISDHLGTPRMVLDETGNLANMKRHDYLPFGEELFAPTSGRSAAQGYSGGDGVRQQFTSKERDVETGLDYFSARYYTSSQGRFTSPDPFSIIQMRQSARNDAKTNSAFMQFIGDPRRWNRFAYAINSPLVFTDKTGLDIMIIENGPTKGNPIGHTAIAVTGRGVFSPGNGETTTRYDHKDKKNNISGGGVADYLTRESPRRDTTIYVVKTTPEQDAAIVNSMVEQAHSKRDISQDKKSLLLIDNCSTRVNEALDKAGGELVLPIDPPLAVQPGSAGARAMLSGLPVTVISIPQGTNVSNLKDAEKQIIENFEPRDRPMKKPDE